MDRVTVARAAVAVLAAANYLLAQTVPDKRVTPASVQARRVALVVGNVAYPSGPLRNSVNDAQAVSAALRDLGFTVQLETNVDLPGFDRAVKRFAGSLHAGDVALFYYSGHGVQVEGENYLIPVDFQASQEAEVRWKAMPATQVHELMLERGAALSIVVLDACRDNPFRSARSATRGLASMNSGKGSLIAFATAPGATASDNPAESNGLFTKYLLETLREPGLDVEDVFKRVRQQVVAASQGRQVPWTASSVIGTFILRDPAEERARLERELQDLERQIADASRRKADQEQAEKERTAALLRERLKLQPPPAPKDDAESEPAHLDELRRKREQEQSQLDALGGQAMTIEQARQDVAALERKIEEDRTEVNAARDEALRRLPPELAAEKGTFETTAQFEARQQKAVAAHTEVEKRYASEFEAAAAPLRKRAAELKSGTYPLAPAKVEFTAYNADSGLLTARINGEARLFAVPPEKAKSLYEQAPLVKVEQSLDAASLALIDPATREKFAGSGKAKVNPKDGQAYVWIPPGTFLMGCSPGDSECDYVEKPAHQVTITKGFWLGQTLVTQEAYVRVAGSNPSNFKGPKLPVENVSWKDAFGYCQKAGMRLPTEAEWEYGARAGTTGARYGNLDAIAWYNGNSAGKTHEVAQKQPNAWGLYDMLGNVWEWVADWYADKYAGGSQTDPTGLAGGQLRLLRGGSWSSVSGSARASFRGRSVPEGRNGDFGLRCAGN